ncbi:glycoside hydrolase family 25 protein [Beijerinckia sp. L45]|uniref:glycoside hydrolase family 25 protein n=1 Tax=Beijerinckia sp. L45 TaxID=1641855 RepID=UPI00131BBF17|nr:glycoside hydrolase family 25 protein [Beijerinckia sp. L45]
MGQAVEIQLLGAVETTVSMNLRQGVPNTKAPVFRKVNAGTLVPVISVVVGESVQGNPHWYRTAEDAFIWAGGCGLFRDAEPAAPLPRAPVSLSGAPIIQLKKPPAVVDLCHGSGVVCFEDARSSGLVGVIHKATTGASGRDDAYRGRREAAQAAGLLWGAYHCGTGAPVEDQMRNFLEWAQPDAQTLVALEFETTVGNQMTLEGARHFCEQIFAVLGRRPVIYSGDALKAALGVANDPFFGAHRLWLAQYSDKPTVQRSWRHYWLWQYTDGQSGPGPRTVPGLAGDRAGRLYCDQFDGDPQDLAAQWAQ